MIGWMLAGAAGMLVLGLILAAVIDPDLRRDLLDSVLTILLLPFVPIYVVLRPLTKRLLWRKVSNAGLARWLGGPADVGHMLVIGNSIYLRLRNAKRTGGDQ